MFRILTAVSVFTLAYVTTVFAETAKIDPAAKAIAKGIFGLFTLIIILIITGIGFLILIWKIAVKIYFREKAKYEAKIKDPNPTQPQKEKPKNNTTQKFNTKEEYLKWKEKIKS